MRLGFPLIALLLSACAVTRTEQPSPAQPAHASQREAPAPAPPLVKESQGEAEESSPQNSKLRESISLWIAENPHATFEEASRTANRLLRLNGYPMVLDAAGLIKRGQTRLRLRAGGKIFVFEAGKELSRSPDVCGERFLRLPARPLGADRAALIQNGKSYAFSLKPFRRERFRVFREGKQLSVLFAPEPTEPIGLANSGKALFLRFPLNESLTAGWWQRIAVDQPAVMGEEPYLLVQVQRNRLFFDENPEHLPPQEFEVEEGTGAAFRWRFMPSELVLELSSKCG